MKFTNVLWHTILAPENWRKKQQTDICYLGHGHSCDSYSWLRGLIVEKNHLIQIIFTFLKYSGFKGRLAEILCPQFILIKKLKTICGRDMSAFISNLLNAFALFVTIFFLMLWHNYALLAYSCILLNAYAYVCFLHHLLLNLLLGVHHQSIIFHTQTIKVALTNLRKCCCGTNIWLYFVCFLSYTWPPAFLSPPLTWSKGKIFVSINMNHGYVMHQFFSSSHLTCELS